MVLPQLEPDSDAETPRESSIDSTATVNLKQEENQPSAEPETVPTEENHPVNVEDPGAGGDQTPGECFITVLHKNTWKVTGTLVKLVWFYRVIQNSTQ